ncbi:MAG: hypothetical protein ABI693_24845 [Bryobacteraceae bacterium]
MAPSRLVLSLASALFIASAARAADAGALFQQIDGIVAELSEITGLKAKSKVAYAMIDRSQLKDFLESRIKEEVKPEELRAEETTLKKLGFLPQDFDLRASTVDLLTEQAAAFYDFRKKKLFVLDTTSGQMQQTALVHELAHALADQHFNLGRFMEHGVKSDDASTARMAVMEGQASWLMTEYMARHQGQSLKDNRALMELMTSGDFSGSQFPVLEKTPLYLRETLLFPYTKGMLFQHVVYEKLDRAAFAEVFRTPPATTQQIIHPDAYFAHRRPVDPPLPELPAALKRWKELSAGTMGELDHSLLLRQYAGKETAADLSPKWSGGRYRVIEQSKGGPAALQYVSEWETEEAAADYFHAYRKVLTAKWKEINIRRDEGDLLTGHGDDGDFVVRLEGKRVSSIEGQPAPPL